MKLGEFLFGVNLLLWAVALFGVIAGIWFFLKPQQTIRFYQKIMQWLNWRVEPINFAKEIFNTKWLGALIAVLSLSIVLALLSGCAAAFAPRGYQLLETKKMDAGNLSAGTSHEFLGFISKDKLEIIHRYGLPDLVSTQNLEIEQSERKISAWVYLSQGKELFFYQDTEELLLERDLNSYDIASYHGELEAGMTPEQVQRVKGRPSYIDAANVDYGASEKWVYRLNDDTVEALYFSGGMLLTWRTESKEQR